MSVERNPSRALPPPLAPPATVRLVMTPPRACPYLPGRRATDRAFYVDWLPPDLYHDFMDAGFRRSGKVIYQPACEACRECRSIRIPVDRFAPGKTQRRVWRRNQDLIVTTARPRSSDEKHDLFQRYLAGWHDGAMSDDRESFEQFLYESPVDTIEFEYREPDGRLIAVGLCDLCTRSLSSVYFYFEPESAWRSLGTFGAMYELAYAREREIPWYYLGYWVAGCRTMQYKTDYRPNEILGPDGVWKEAAPRIQPRDGCTNRTGSNVTSVSAAADDKANANSGG